MFDDFPAEKAKELMQLAGSFGALPAASDAGAEPVCQNAPGQPCFAGTDRATLVVSIKIHAVRRIKELTETCGMRLFRPADREEGVAP